LQERTEIKKSEQLEKKISYLSNQVIKTIRESNTEEEVFLEYLDQFTNLLLIKHLSIKDKQEYHLTEKEKKEREILDKIVANWFYKTSHQ
jgi:transcription initiation factor TFIID subunit TAF12